MPGAGPALSASLARLVAHLASRDDVLLLTTSNRYEKHHWDIPKSTQLAIRIGADLTQQGKRVKLIDVASLHIYPCEGNISGARGNNCGVREAKLRDATKNPTGHHRCWASVNNNDDELYEVSRALFRCRAVVFFVSVRWGQANSVYQRLLERLSWIENRFTSLGESHIPQLKSLEAGIVVFGHNWNDLAVMKTQQKNFSWFGWKTPTELSLTWQYARDADDESPASYVDAVRQFDKLVQLVPLHARKRTGPPRSG